MMIIITKKKHVVTYLVCQNSLSFYPSFLCLCKSSIDKTKLNLQTASGVNLAIEHIYRIWYTYVRFYLLYPMHFFHAFTLFISSSSSSSFLLLISLTIAVLVFLCSLYLCFGTLLRFLRVWCAVFVLRLCLVSVSFFLLSMRCAGFVLWLWPSLGYFISTVWKKSWRHQEFFR